MIPAGIGGDGVATVPARPASRARGRRPGQPQLTLGHVQRERMGRRLAAFVRGAWEQVEPATEYVHGRHIDVMADALEAVTRGDVRRLVVNVPPRYMKSLTVSVFWPAWLWLHDPALRLLYASYGQTLSTRDALRTRRLIQSGWYQERWGDRYTLTGDQNEKTRYENDRTGIRLATSVGGSATGEGGDVIVADDPHKLEDAHSDAARTAALEWWDGTMSTRLNDPRTGRQVVVMQRIHADDLTGHVLEQGGWEHVCLPAEYEPAHPFAYRRDWRTEPGQLLWPERHGPVEVAQLKSQLGTLRTAGQLQQRPSPEAGNLLRRSWWRYVTERPAIMDEWLASWDMSFRDADDTDYVVGQLWSRAGARYYLHDQVRDRMDFPTALRTSRTVRAKWAAIAGRPVDTWLVEKAANGEAIMAVLRDEMPGVVGVTPRESKVARVAAVSATVEAGNVYLPEPDVAPWVADFVEECAAFPNAPHDDMVDAFAHAIRRLKATTVTVAKLER